ncbi:MAG: LacI family DNA-binding transcriptional regulator [Reichenbachiella sp.]
MPERITIKEIARLANVSIGTVDRVLHNRGRVAQATKDNILAIAKKGNYSSNIYARSLKLNKTFRIAVLLPDDNSYWDKHREGVSRGALELENMGFVFDYYVISNTNEESRFQAINKALNSKPDGLILTPSMLNPKGRSLKLLEENHVPYVFVDSSMDNVENLSFVGQNAFQSGRMAGQLLSNVHSQGFHVYVVTLSSVDLQKKTVIDRMAGLESFFSQNSAVKVSKINLESDGIEMAQLKLKLESIGKPIHLLVPNSKSYLLVNELKELREKLQLRVVGYDLIDENVQCLKEGLIDYIIDQQPINQGYLATQTLYKYLLLKTEVKKAYNMPLDIITKENIMYCDY